MRAVILDRDGVINRDSDEFIKSPEEWLAIPGSLEGTVKLSEIGRNKATRADRHWRISGHSQTAVDAPEGGNLPKYLLSLVKSVLVFSRSGYPHVVPSFSTGEV